MLLQAFRCCFWENVAQTSSVAYNRAQRNSCLESQQKMGCWRNNTQQLFNQPLMKTTYMSGRNTPLEPLVT